jgi:hypothetical protein
MSRRSQPWVLRYWGPDRFDEQAGRMLTDKGRSSYADPDAALRNAREAAVSRAARCPASHVTVTHRETGEAIFEWHGPEAEGPAVREAMKDAGFPVIPPGEIAAEVAADVHRLGP